MNICFINESFDLFCDEFYESVGSCKGCTAQQLNDLSMNR